MLQLKEDTTMKIVYCNITLTHIRSYGCVDQQKVDPLVEEFSDFFTPGNDTSFIV
jgi:hypothetical protein